MSKVPNILLVDDNLDLLQTFALILKLKGYRVDTASNGEEAVSKFRSRTFDVVLTDSVMPGMDGITAFHEIRATNPQAKVILMTAYSEDVAILKALADGLYCVINKPVHLNELEQALKEVINPQVLIVDDDPDFRDSLSRALSAAGYNTATAASAEEAVERVKEREYQIALVDLKMPESDGIETCKALRSVDPSLPFVLMTGYREKLSEEGTREVGVGHLLKPFDPSQAIALTNEHCKGRYKGKVWREHAKFS